MFEVELALGNGLGMNDMASDVFLQGFTVSELDVVGVLAVHVTAVGLRHNR